MSITRGSQLWWATCLLANIHIITIVVIEIKYDDDDDGTPAQGGTRQNFWMKLTAKN